MTLTEINESCVHNILASGSIEEVRRGALAFIAEAEQLGRPQARLLCKRLSEAVLAWTRPYTWPEIGAPWNAIIVPPIHAPVMLLPCHVPIGGAPQAVIAGMRDFVAKCDEFTPPVYEAITPDEIGRVLTAAQRELGLLDVIAPREPLKMLRFSNSHVMHNSQCGVPTNRARPAFIFLFHPMQNETYDRVFIFAHELGHALHLSLTRSEDVLPERFDEFNASLGVTIDDPQEKREAFADAVAYAILSAKELQANVPAQFSGVMTPHFVRYVRWLAAQAKATPPAGP